MLDFAKQNQLQQHDNTITQQHDTTDDKTDLSRQ